MLEPELFEGTKDLLRVLVSEAFRRTIQACETSLLAGAYCSLHETLHNFEEDTLMNWLEEGLFPASRILAPSLRVGPSTIRKRKSNHWFGLTSIIMKMDLFLDSPAGQS